jgi:hypothetical protein
MTDCLFLILIVLVVKSVGGFSFNKSLNPPLVTIDVGQVLGTMKEASTGNTVYQFLGVPYAEPPIGSLRFEPPVPVARFQSIIETTAFKPSCIQVFAGMNTEKKLPAVKRIFGYNFRILALKSRPRISLQSRKSTRK